MYPNSGPRDRPGAWPWYRILKEGGNLRTCKICWEEPFRKGQGAFSREGGFNRICQDMTKKYYGKRWLSRRVNEKKRLSRFCIIRGSFRRGGMWSFYGRSVLTCLHMIHKIWESLKRFFLLVVFITILWKLFVQTIQRPNWDMHWKATGRKLWVWFSSWFKHLQCKRYKT